MGVKAYLNILLGQYRSLARYVIRKYMKKYGVNPAFIAYTLYLILGTPHRLEGDILEGPRRIGNIDLKDIGFRGLGIIRPEYDLDLAGEVYSKSIERLARIVDQESISSAIKAYAYRLASVYEDEKKLMRSIEEEMSLAPNGSKIDLFIDQDEAIVELEYHSPIASMSSYIGSLYAYSIAYSLEPRLGIVIDEEVYEEDEYRLVASFKFS